MSLKEHSIFLLIPLIFLSCRSNQNQNIQEKQEYSWHEENGYKWTKINPLSKGNVGFVKLEPNQTNINFINQLSEETINKNRTLMNGSGVAAGDIDGDGLIDLYFANLEKQNRLYKNKGGMEFEDITEEAGVAHEGKYSIAAVFADVDGDIDLDLLVTSNTGISLYLNDGNGKFSLKNNSGLRESRGGTSMALADIDNDSDLDLYVVNNKVNSPRNKYDLSKLSFTEMVQPEGNRKILKPKFREDFKLIYKNGKPDLIGVGEMDQLFINKGKGKFKEVSNPNNYFFTTAGEEKGLERDWGLAAKFQDIDGDLDPDLYVCNDYWTSDRFWINQGDGTFRAIKNTSIRNFSYSSMSVDFSDINRDGHVDFFVTEMLSNEHQQRMSNYANQYPLDQRNEEIEGQPQYNKNSLYLNRGDTSFAELAYFGNVEATNWSWSTSFLDVNLDGYEDIIVTTGYSHNFQDLDASGRSILNYPPLPLINRALRNDKDLTFTDMSEEWGFVEKDISHGMATADLDNDGDLDLVVNRLNKVAAIYENRVSAPRVAVRLKGISPNTQGIGSKIILKGGPVTQQKEVVSGGNYASGSESVVMFAANKNEHHQIKIIWRDGTVSNVDSIKANRLYIIDESTIKKYKKEKQKGEKRYKKIFKDVSNRLDHVHVENEFDDSSLQALLPFKLSQLGPGVSWIDYDQDGDDDLFIASGKGGKLGIFKNMGNGSFQSQNFDNLTNQTGSDQTTILGWWDDGGARLVVGRAGNEKVFNGSSSVQIYNIEKGQISKIQDLSSSKSSTGPLTAADYDGDGDIDLFVGGRFIPGFYPMNASSRLYKNKEGKLVLDKGNSKLFDEVGLVTGAVFSDYDQDGDQDLLVSTEWGSIKLFQNNGGKFKDVTHLVGLDQYKGWWNGLATGDFNNDGLPDIVATNMGLNSIYQINEKPLRMYFEDFNHDLKLEILESYFDEGVGDYVPRKQYRELSRSISSLNNIQSHSQYGRSSLQKILNQNLHEVPYKEINTLEHMVFINKGNKFIARPLPEESQWSTAFFTGVADFNNDGNEDILLSQNLFTFPRMIPRQDAGRALWLEGDRTGSFIPVSGNKSGIKVYGEQRGAAISDFNKDGKVDLAISQNDAPTNLFLNQTETSGIRIILKGPESNPQGIGSSIRLIYDDGLKGPLREVQAGSGYWSQNSATQIMGLYKNKVKKIKVIWYDGTIQTVDILNNKKRYRIFYPSKTDQ